MTTVGYGDISPTNNDEMVFGIFGILIGGTVFGFFELFLFPHKTNHLDLINHI